MANKLVCGRSTYYFKTLKQLPAQNLKSDSPISSLLKIYSLFSINEARILTNKLCTQDLNPHVFFLKVPFTAYIRR